MSGLYDAEALSAANARRLCCVCGDEAVVTCCGSDAQWQDMELRTKTGGLRKMHTMTVPAVADIDLCLRDAALRWRRTYKHTRQTASRGRTRQ